MKLKRKFSIFSSSCLLFIFYDQNPFQREELNVRGVGRNKKKSENCFRILWKKVIKMNFLKRNSRKQNTKIYPFRDKIVLLIIIIVFTLFLLSFCAKRKETFETFLSVNAKRTNGLSYFTRKCFKKNRSIGDILHSTSSLFVLKSQISILKERQMKRKDCVKG